MKDVRFYEEFTNTSKYKSLGTVVAVLVGNGYAYKYDGMPFYDAVGSVGDTATSGVTSCAVQVRYLSSRCKRISEQRAREIHPAIFTLL